MTAWTVLTSVTELAEPRPPLRHQVLVGKEVQINKKRHDVQGVREGNLRLTCIQILIVKSALLFPLYILFFPMTSSPLKLVVESIHSPVPVQIVENAAKMSWPATRYPGNAAALNRRIPRVQLSLSIPYLIVRAPQSIRMQPPINKPYITSTIILCDVVHAHVVPDTHTLFTEACRAHHF